MDKTALMVNAGSSSLKTSLYELPSLKLIRRDNFVNIGGLNTPFKELKKKLDQFSIELFGHRIVHGGHLYTKCTEIDSDVLKNLNMLSDLAPLHNPFGIEAIFIAKQCFGNDSHHFALFDTAFHSTIPSEAATYAIDRTLIEKYHLKKYGFHGLACESVKEILKKKFGKLPTKIAILHLGSGSSISALKNGISIENSMGFTPNEGLVMATRSGDIDSGLLEYIARKENLSLKTMSELLNKKSGLLGFSKCSNDMKVLIDSYDNNPFAKEAVDLYCHRAVRYLAGYFGILEGVDSIVFSGGIGENSSFIREKIISKFSWIGVSIDSEKNMKIQNINPGECLEIQSTQSKSKIFVIGVDESLEMVKQIQLLIDEG